MSDLVTNNLNFGTGDTYKLQDARVDDMYTNAQIDSAIGNKVDKVSGKGLSTEDFTTAEKTKLTNLTQPNNSTITIRQGGVVKGTFTVDSSQDVTIDIDAGGGSVDAYTKAESDARYPSKTYFDVDKINVSDSSYKIELGYDNEIHRSCIAIGEDNTVSNNYSNILIGYFNNCRSYMDSFDGVIMGYMNDASNYDYNVVIGSKIYNSVITQDYEVAIGYGDKPMSVKPSGEVYSRGDVSCDDGSGNRISLRNVKASLNDLSDVHVKEYTFNKNNPATVPIRLHSNYSYMIIGGFLQGTGGVLIGITFNAAAIGTIKDLHNGTNFSSSYISFEKSGNNLLIKSTVDANSFITVFQL